MNKIYLLNNQKFQGVENIEVFKIKYIPSTIDILKYDALIFTSKNAIYSLNSFNKDWKKIPSYVIAQKTAEILEEEGGNLVFNANCKDGNSFAKAVANKLKGKKVLYIRAMKVVSNLVEILKNDGIDIEELVTYKTVCNETLDFKIDDYSVVIFTSPSTIDCFFKSFKWNNTLKAIVIGETTAKYLPLGIKYEVSSKTSIQECIKLAQTVTF